MDERTIRIADHYGATAQGIKLMEECGELVQAISKYFQACGFGAPSIQSVNETKCDVAEEMADVLIMVDQVRYLLDIDKAEVSRWIEVKLNRQIRRIELEAI